MHNRNPLSLLVVAAAAITALCPAATAQVLTSRAALEAVLTDQIEIEDFEFLSLHAGGTFDTPNPLNDAIMPAWGVVPIPTYSSAGTLQLYAAFLNGDDDVLLRGTEGMRIEFDPPQVAAGFQTFGSPGFTKIVRYYNGETELGSHTLDAGFSGFDATATGLTAITINLIADNSTVTINDLAFGLEFICRADANKDGTVNFFDLSEFINLFIDEDDLADLNLDGLWNFFDVSTFITLFNAGC